MFKKFKKKADVATRTLKEKTDVAAKLGLEIGKKAAERGTNAAKDLSGKGASIVAEGVKNVRKAQESSLVNAETLRKLAELKEQGIITEEEFQTKKKELLDRI